MARVLAAFRSVAVLLGVGAGSLAAEEAWPPLHEISPAPGLLSAAAERGVPTERLELTENAGAPPPDDTVVLFVALEEPARQTQWLVQLIGPGAVDAAGADGHERVRELYGMDGRTIRFPSRRETYRIVASEPYHAGSAPTRIRFRDLEVAMEAGFLDERMDRAADFMMRTGRARLEGRLREDEWFSILHRPPQVPDAATRARFVEATGLTDDDERALAATVPALDEFARVIARTPGLRDMLFSVVEKPSLWSILARWGRLETDFRFHSGEVERREESPAGFDGVGRCYRVPFTFSINGKPALECKMLVTRARRPLRMCGGIIGFVATSPDRPEVRLVVRVVAARPGR